MKQDIYVMQIDNFETVTEDGGRKTVIGKINREKRTTEVSTL